MNNHASCATEEGTHRFTQRFDFLAADHFRKRYGLYLSSIGLGTYLGGVSEVESARYVEAVKNAIQSGCNVLDTAVNYRYMQSERDVGQAVKELTDMGELRRDEIVVCTKGGYVPFDGEMPDDPAESIRSRFYATGLAQPMQLVGNQHCMAPDYLSNQIGVSLDNLGLEQIDVYYLHNPETQLNFVTPEEFRKRLREAFARLEEEVEQGRIRFYGVATWDGLRAGRNDRGYLPLSLLVETARELSGERHHFRFIQFPFNLGMLEAVTDSNQIFEGEIPAESRDNGAESGRLELPLLAAARQYAIVAIGSAGLGQGQLLGSIPPELKEILGDFESDAQYSLQFNRSTPGLTTSLVGMGNPEHVPENLAVAQAPALDPEEFFRLFQE